MPAVTTFFYNQLIVTPTKPTDDYTSKTIIVTGSNVGLGKEAARHFTKNGASKVILAVRSIEKGQAAKEDILKTTKVSKDVVDVWQLDMSSYKSTLAFAARAEKELPRLDIAVLNAGVARGTFEMAEDCESTITVNVVSTHLLALALLPKMKETAAKFNTRPTLTIVSSEVHGFTTFPQKSAPEGGIFDKLNENDGKVDMGDRYQISKLLEVLVVRAWADRKGATQIPVTINYVNPGLCQSELAREAGLFLAVMKFFLARSTEVGSRTLVHAASQGPETHGEYLSNCTITQPAPLVLSAEGYKLQERVWGELSKRLEAIQPGITKNL
ncbi:hypothetical protein BDV96DRAFT_615734 [Lophiotrema nucula]|uniref:Short-chain dehydrogenase n=1 Tax=Lophiotrema nucula TaxID=690887 RepID=A0A6A5YQU7_9PLEO|nr:hypothetical protein BDV96DRAFT_615734 [Lophiotrema nucula]